MDENFRDFLSKVRKFNGEKLQPKSAEIYYSYIDRNYDKILDIDLDEYIKSANDLIKLYPYPNLKAALKYYAMFIYQMDIDDERLKSLKSPRKKATSMTSVRELGKNVIPIKDMKILYDALDDQWKLILGMFYESGARESEILNARIKDINFYENPDDKVHADMRILTKGGKYKIVHFFKGTTELLRKYIAGRDEKERIFIFRKPNGKLYKRQEKYLLDRFKKFTKNILGQSYKIHSIRHTAGTHLIENGAELLAVSRYLGHSGVGTTQIYIKGAQTLGKKTLNDHGRQL